MATAQATATTTDKRKSVFTKVDNLKPGTNGHTLTVKVVSSKSVVQKAGARPTSLNAQCIIGYETGAIVFTARYEQVEGLMRLMEGEHVGPFNLGNPCEFTMLELAQTIDLNAKIALRKCLPLMVSNIRQRIFGDHKDHSSSEYILSFSKLTHYNSLIILPKRNIKKDAELKTTPYSLSSRE